MGGFVGNWRSLFAAVALAAGACGADGGETGNSTGAVAPCNSLEIPPQAIQLAELLGAGRDAADTLYVVDRTSEHGLRLFTSEATVLQRRPVTGSGEGADSEGEFFTVAAAEMDLRVKVSIAASGARRMGVLRGEPALRDFIIGQQGEELALVDDDSVRALAVQNLANGVVIEYFAVLDDGRQLLVSRPEHDFDYDDFRLFFGSAGRLIERAVSRVERQRDGGTTDIAFDLDGAPALAHFPAPARNEPSRLSVKGEDWTLAPIDGGVPASLELLCLVR